MEDVEDDEGVVFSLGEFDLEARLDSTISPLLKGLAAGVALIKLLPESEPEFMCAAGAVQNFLDRLRAHPDVDELRSKVVALNELRLTEADPEEPEEHVHVYATVYAGPVFPPDGEEGGRRMISVGVCYCTAVVLEEK